MTVSPSRTAALNACLMHPWAKPLLWLAWSLPLLGLCLAVALGQVGPNPVDHFIRETGEWALRLLWLTLAITPLRDLAGLPGLLRHRRALGVAAALYGLVHFLAYAWLDQGLLLQAIVADALKRNFILVGLLAGLLMLPLALTSFNAAVRALGGRRWQMLHKLAYAAALLGLLHFYLKRASKNDLSEVAVHAALLAALLGWRVIRKGGVLAMLRVRP